jgi:hypothetical protein
VVGGIINNDPSTPQMPDEGFAELVKMICELADGLRNTRHPLTVETLTFAEVVRYFTRERPADLTVHHGALLVQRRLFRDITCVQVFLDEADNLCHGPFNELYGRVMSVKQLDRQLADLAAVNDLIIFK